MANTIQIKRSATAGSIPSLDDGELGVNLTDNTLYAGQDHYTKLLIHSDNIDESDPITDASPSGHTITATNAVHKTTQKKFGASSIYFDGTGDYLRTAASNFLSGNWTVECWFYYAASFPSTVEGLIALDYDGSGSSNNAMNFGVTNGAMSLNASSDVSSGWNIASTTGGTVSANAWHHGAVVFNGSAYKVYLDGVVVITVTSSTAVASQNSSQIVIGTTADSSSGQSWNGYIDEVRVSGTARFTAAFTPPTRRYGVMSPEPTGDHLPLSGGTLTGALSGTTAAFSGHVDLNSSCDVAGLLRINDKVGIKDGGWYAPTKTLDVDGTGNFTGTLYGVGAAFSGHVDLNNSCDVAGLLRINDKVGIKDGGWYTPTATLDVSGTLNVTGALTGASATFTQGAFFNGNVGVVDGSGSGTLVGRFQIGHSTTTSANNSLVFWQGAKPTLGSSHGAILYETNGIGSGESLTFMSGNGYRFLNQAGDAEWVRFDNGGAATFSGHVGIGTASPATNFHLHSTSDEVWQYITTDVANKDVGIYMGLDYDGTANFSGIVFDQSDDALKLFNNNSIANHLVIKNDGNIGIGTAAPIRQLDLTGSVSGQYSAAFINTSTTGHGVYIKAAPNSASYMALAVDDKDGASILVARGDKKVGIGTNAPANRLHISQDNNSEYSPTGDPYNNAIVQIRNTNTTASIPASLIHFRLDKNGGDGYLGFITDGSTGNVEHFVLGTQTGNEMLRINKDGNVGIGTGDIASKLHLYEETSNTNTVSHLLTIDSMSSGTTAVGFGGGIQFRGERSGGTLQGMGRIQCVAEYNTSSNLSSALTFHTATSGVNSEKVRIKNGGEVGIGTDSPGAMLDAVGPLGIRTRYASSATTKRIDIQAGNTGNLIQYVTNPLTFWNSTTATMTMLQDGKVGIGCTDPAYTLEVRKTVDTDWVSRIYNTSTNANSYGLLVRSANAASTTTHFGVYNGTVHTFAIKGDGKVGIGTTAPSTLLQIESTDPVFTLERSGHGTANGAINFQGNDNVVDWQIGTNRAVGTGFEINHGSDTANKFYITTDGKVGIGTPSPAAKLDIIAHSSTSWTALRTSGAVKFYTTTSDGSELRYVFNMGGASDAAYAYLYKADASTIGISLNAGGHTYFNGGNVGIGTTSPSEALHISQANDGGDTSLRIQNADGGNSTDETVQIQFYHTGSGADGGKIVSGREGLYTYPWANADSFLAFHTSLNNANTERLRITSGGNVGIGTTAPEYPLHISGADSAIYLVGSDQGRIILQDTGATSNSQAFDIVSKEDKLHFRRLNNGRDSVQATVMALSGDKVGIGTTSPSKLLHCKVTSGTAAPVQIQGYSDASTPKLLVLGTASYPNGTLGLTTISGHGYLETYGAMDLHLRPNQSTGMVVKSGGNVGIGTTSPGTYKLYVAGTTYLGNDTTLGSGKEFLLGSTTEKIYSTSSYVIIDGANGTIFRDSGSNKIIQNGSYFRPDSNNSMYLGSTGERWAQVYSVLGNFSGALTVGGNINKTGDLTLDSSGNIVLDADGGGVYFKDAGTNIGFLQNDGSSNFRLVAGQQDKDIVFMGNDGGSSITALTLDMSEAGAATFGGALTAGSATFAKSTGVPTDFRTANNLLTLQGNGDVDNIASLKFGWGTGTPDSFLIQAVGVANNNGYFRIARQDSGSVGITQLLKIDNAGAATFSGTVNANYVISTNYASASSLRIPSTTNYHEIWSNGDELRIYRNQSSAINVGASNLVTFSGAVELDGGIKDKNDSTGSASHVLHSDGLGRVYWTTAPSATIPSSVTHKYYTYIQLTTAAGNYYTITHSLGESDVIVAVRRAISGTATRSARFAADAGVHLDVGYDVQVTSCDANGAASSNHVSLYFDNYSIVNNEYVYVTVIG